MPSNWAAPSPGSRRWPGAGPAGRSTRSPRRSPAGSAGRGPAGWRRSSPRRGGSGGHADAAAAGAQRRRPPAPRPPDRSSHQCRPHPGLAANGERRTDGLRRSAVRCRARRSLRAPPRAGRPGPGTASRTRSQARRRGRSATDSGSPPCSPQTPSLMSGPAARPSATAIGPARPRRRRRCVSNGDTREDALVQVRR